MVIICTNTLYGIIQMNMPVSPVVHDRNPRRCLLCLWFLSCTLEEIFCSIGLVLYETLYQLSSRSFACLFS